MKRLTAAAVVTALLQGIACKQAGPREEALARAIQARDLEAARAALASGADPDVRPSGSRVSRSYPWLVVDEMSAYPRQADALEAIGVALFAAGADPNHQSGSGSRAMYLVERAAAMDRPVLVDAMLKAGLNVRSEGTGRALISASLAGHTAVVERLIAGGADVNFHWWRYRARGAETPLSEAVVGRHAATIEVLERAGAQEW